MYNYQFRNDTANILIKNEPDRFKPHRKQPSQSQNQHLHSDIFLQSDNRESTKPLSINQHNRQSTNEIQVRSTTKVDFPRPKSNIFSQQPLEGSRREYNGTFKSQILGNQPKEMETQGHKININKIPDHSKEYLLHCAPPDSSTDKPSQRFEPKYAEYSQQKSRERDFINNEVTMSLINKPHSAQPKQQEQSGDLSYRKNNQKKSNLLSNILGLPDKDISNREHLNTQKINVKDLTASAGKSMSHPWLQRSQALQVSKLNLETSFEQRSYAQNKKQEMLRSSYDAQNIQNMRVQENDLLNTSINISDKINSKMKSQFIQSQCNWNQFDSILNGNNYQNQEKTHYPQPETGIIKKKQQTPEKELSQENERFPLGSQNNKYYNVTIATQEKVNDSEVGVIRLSMDVKQNSLDVQDLRLLCRQNGFHLVKYDEKYNNISNQSQGKSEMILRGSPSKDLNQLKSSLSRKGIDASESETSNGLKMSKSNVMQYQEKQMKDIQQLEKYYLEQANNFLNKDLKKSQLNRNAKSASTMSKIKYGRF